MFLADDEISLHIDRIHIKPHVPKKNIMGVTFHQKCWNSHDTLNSWSFILCDFNNSSRMDIHILTYQTDAEAQANGIFGVDDFYIP